MIDRHPLLSLLAGCALALSGCSKGDEGSGLPRTSGGGSSQAVVSAPWGSGVGQLGRERVEEGSAEGPTSFVVDAAGRVHLLDSVNGRIQIFTKDAPPETVMLPPGLFDDLEIVGPGRYALLSLHYQPGIVFLKKDGSVEAEVGFTPPFIDTPSLITALHRVGEELWVEVGDESLVRVAGLDGKALEPDTVLGKLLGPSGALGVNLEGETVSITAAGAGSPLATLQVGARASEVTLLAPGTDGGMLVAIRSDIEGDDPEVSVESHRLYALNAKGAVQWSAKLPTLSEPERVFRAVRMGDDGWVYALNLTAKGAEIVKVTP